MLLGSQVSLKYDLDLSLTQVPENLIFYSDEEMTTAFLKENGAIHLDGTFLANDNNKTASKTIYWAWPIETGLTQTEINHNDELDSEWIGSDVIVGINATGRQIMGDPSEEYTVTLDLNGGTLAEHGDSAMLTKQVTYGEAYGTLPTPTRDGYIFKGWNGKNLLKYEDIAVYWGTKDNDKVYLDASSVEGNVANYFVTQLYNDGSYVRGIALMKIGEYLVLNFTKTSEFNKFLVKLNTSKLDPHFKFNLSNLQNDNNYTFSCKIEMIDYEHVKAVLSNIQIENGDELTEYEPYYLTTSTPVTQNKNHTLTAIWEPI